MTLQRVGHRFRPVPYNVKRETLPRKEQTMTDANDYLTMEEVIAGRKTTFVGEYVTAGTIKLALEATAKLIVERKLGSLVDALENAVPNIDMGARYICKYDLRQACSEKLALAAGRLKQTGSDRTPLAIVQEALAVYKERERKAALEAAKASGEVDTLPLIKLAPAPALTAADGVTTEQIRAAVAAAAQKHAALTKMREDA
jgi:hypothetical protein